VHRPWGSYQSLDQRERYQVKAHRGEAARAAVAAVHGIYFTVRLGIGPIERRPDERANGKPMTKCEIPCLCEAIPEWSALRA
jgi:hypothetical protein